MILMQQTLLLRSVGDLRSGKTVCGLALHQYARTPRFVVSDLTLHRRCIALAKSRGIRVY